MSLALLNNVADVIADLLDGVTFDDPTGGTTEFNRFVGSLPPKRDAATRGEDFPYFVVSLGDFSFDRVGYHKDVEVVFGIWSSGKPEDGMADLDRLFTALYTVAQPKYNPFALIGQVEGQTLKAEHPYYILSLTLTFRGTLNQICQ